MNGTRKYFLALDAGTSAVKAGLFDAAGRQRAVHAAEYDLEHPAPDRVELDPEVYWLSAKSAISAVMKESGVPPPEIAALGVTSQGETLIVLDRQGKPLRKAVVWLDNRATEEAGAIAGAFDPETVYRITGQQEIVPCWTAAKILWLRRHEPRCFAQAARFLMVADYLLYRLTGRYASDHGLNPSTLYYDLTAGDWWDPMLDFLGIRREQLPELFFSGTPIGRVRPETGLDGGTLVVTAPIDQLAGAVGAGNLAPGMLTETTGSAMAICATCDTPRYDPRRRIGLYRHALPTAYALLPWVPTAGMIFRWFRDRMAQGRSFSELAREAEGVPPGAEGLLLLPHLNGAFLPETNPAARGVFYGVTLGHTRAHFVRALFEAVAFMLRDALEILAGLDVATHRVCSLGGGARSGLWLQIKADVLNREVLTVDTKEVAALGVAILAAAGAGVYRTAAEAAEHMVRYRGRFAPVARAVEVYEETFQNYNKLNRIILPTFGGSR